MISKMTFADAVSAHANFLTRIGGNPKDAEAAILTFHEWDEPKGAEFGQDVRIVLVSANFSKEITTSVLWLNERELDIRCVRLIPYLFMDRTLLDIQQVLPLPEASEYQVRLRKKAAEERSSQKGDADWTRYDLTIGEKVFANLYKRQLFLTVVRELVEQRKSVEELQQILPARKFVGVPGTASGSDFRATVSVFAAAGSFACEVSRRWDQLLRHGAGVILGRGPFSRDHEHHAGRTGPTIRIGQQ